VGTILYNSKDLWLDREFKSLCCVNVEAYKVFHRPATESYFMAKSQGLKGQDLGNPDMTNRTQEKESNRCTYMKNDVYEYKILVRGTLRVRLFNWYLSIFSAFHVVVSQA
jgi:hypothetical protein